MVKNKNKKSENLLIKEAKKAHIARLKEKFILFINKKNNKNLGMIITILISIGSLFVSCQAKNIAVKSYTLQTENSTFKMIVDMKEWKGKTNKSAITVSSDVKSGNIKARYLITNINNKLEYQKISLNKQVVIKSRLLKRGVINNKKVNYFSGYVTFVNRYDNSVYMEYVYLYPYIESGFKNGGVENGVTISENSMLDTENVQSSIDKVTKYVAHKKGISNKEFDSQSYSISNNLDVTPIKIFELRKDIKENLKNYF